MLIYEKKVEENDELVRHLFGTEGNIPSEDDVQLSYKDANGTAVSGLTVTSKLLDDGHGGIKTEDGSAVNVWLGDKNIVPGNFVEPELVSIAVTKQPTATNRVGDPIKYTGIQVTGTLSNGVTGTIGKANLTFDPAENTVADKEGELTVTVSYEEITTTFKIVVDAATQPAE